MRNFHSEALSPPRVRGRFSASSYRWRAVPAFLPASGCSRPVEFMCAEELEDFPEPTSCINSIVRPTRLHKPPIAQPSIQSPSKIFQLCPLVTRTHVKPFCRIPEFQSPPKVTCSLSLPIPPYTCCVLGTASYPQNLQDIVADFDQRKLRPCGSAYLCLYKFTPPNKYFEGGSVGGGGSD